VLAVILIEKLPFIEDMENRALDYRFRTFSQEERASREIVLLTIDDSSLEYFMEHGIVWPWPRDYYAEVVNYFERVGAKAVLFDLLFYEQDIERFDVEAEVTDGRFARAMSAYGKAVLAGQMMHEEIAVSDYLERLNVSAKLEGDKVVREYSGVRAPIDKFLQTTGELGIINVLPDEDGIVRRIPMLYNKGDLILSQFALAGLLASGEVEEITYYEGVFSLDGREIPLDKDGNYLINWYGSDGPQGSFTYYPFSAAIQSAVADKRGVKTTLPAEAFRGKYVIIGATAPGLRDLLPTPVSKYHPGAELWATVLSNILNEEFVRLMSDEWRVIYYLLLSFLLVICFTRDPFRRGNIMVGFIFLSVFLLPLLSWHFYRLEIRMVAPLITVVLSFMYITTISYISEGKAKREIKQAFGRYLHPEVVEHLIENPELVDFKGYEYNATVFFTDIYDFTAFSERNTPQELIRLLNEYFDSLTANILDNEGMLDKFMGDGIMAIFGVPVATNDHPYKACKAALEHKKRWLELKDRIKDTDYVELFHLNTRIGIHTGNLVAGNIGSSQRVDYTAIGDTVNLGSRLEGMNKYYQTHIILSESTYQRVKEFFVCRELDYLRVKGKSEPTRIFELLALRGEGEFSWVETYLKGLQYYREGLWDKAMEIFHSLTEPPLSDKVSKIMFDRCQELKKNSPIDWNGIYIWEVK
jgi:adenylate cyclase